MRYRARYANSYQLMRYRARYANSYQLPVTNSPIPNPQSQVPNTHMTLSRHAALTQVPNPHMTLSRHAALTQIPNTHMTLSRHAALTQVPNPQSPYAACGGTQCYPQPPKHHKIS